MRFLNLASVWAIEPSSARQYLRVYDSILARKNGAEVEAAVPSSRGGVEDVRRFAVDSGVATINVRGPIVPHADLFSEVSGMASVEGIRTQLAQAMASEDVRAVIMSFDSPGGVTTGVSDLAHAIRAASEQKPIVAFTEGVCASAANWLAAGATQRVVSSTGLMGSIGCMMAWVDDRRQMEMVGLEDVEFIASQSPNKSPKYYEEAGKAQIQQLVDDNCAVFINDLAALYGVPAATVKSDFGQGGVFTGKKAVKAGLADRVGSYDQIFAELARGKMPQRAKPRLAATAAQGASMNALDRIRAIINGEEVEAESAQAAAQLPPAQTGQVLVAGMTEAEVVALQEKVREQEAQAQASHAEQLRQEAILRESSAVAFANKYAPLFPANGSDVEGDEIESDRAKYVKSLTDLHIGAQQTGTVEQLAQLCAFFHEPKVGISDIVLGADALAGAKPVEGNQDGEKVAIKAAKKVEEKYKGVDPTKPYTEG